MTHTAQTVAELYARGESLTDAEIRALQHTDLDGNVAIDPTCRAKYLQKSNPDERPITHGEMRDYINKQFVPTFTREIGRLEHKIARLAQENARLQTRVEVLESAVRELRVAPGTPSAGFERIESILAAPVRGRRVNGELIAERVMPEKPPTAEQKLADLEQQVKALSDRPGITYKGVWKADEDYAAGSFVTHSGSCWHAEIASKGVRPGDANSMWKLAVKGTR